MKLRCPYCKTVFPALAEARCPSCGKALRMPESGTQPKKRWRSMRFPQGAPPRQCPPFLVLPWLIIASRPRGAILTIVLVGAIAARLLMTKLPTSPATPHEPVAVTRARLELGVLRTALEWFASSCNRYPTTEEGLRALVRNPGVPGWDGCYIESLYPDPWRHPYQYASSNNTTMTLYSLGPDGLAQTADDVAAPPPDIKAVMERIIPP